VDATAAGLVAKQRATGPENTASLAELFVSFLVETGAVFDAWADAAHMTGPENHDIYKCAARQHYGFSCNSSRDAWLSRGQVLCPVQN
jgi:hypothetical protein